MTLRPVPTFTLVPDIDEPREHQPRERSILCRHCSASTPNVHARCDRCLPIHGLETPCDCTEGRLARGVL